MSYFDKKTNILNLNEFIDINKNITTKEIINFNI